MTSKGAHHRRSIRLPRFDYSSPGAYFVTIVTKDRAALFGAVVDGEMRISVAGSIADRSWREIPEHFQNAELGSYVVMPNHIHGILILRATSSVTVGAHNGIDTSALGGRGTINRAPTEVFGAPCVGSVPTMVRTYKAAVTRAVRRFFEDHQTIWQRNYYEHIIRNEADWDRVRRYIEANPRNWYEDEENPATTRT